MRKDDYEQKFGVGDFAILEDEFFDDLTYRVRIEMPIQNEDGSWWYEVKVLDYVDYEKPTYKEVPQSRLRAI